MILHNKPGKDVGWEEVVRGCTSERERNNVCLHVCVFFFQTDRLGGRGQLSVMQQSCGRRRGGRKKTGGKETGTRGSEGVRREVADSERKISRRGS